MNWRLGSKFPFVKKSVVSQRYLHPVLGKVHIRRLSSARNITARWKDAETLAVTIPPGITPDYLEDALASLTPTLLAKRPEKDFYELGWRYETPETTFEVVRGKEADYFSGRVDRVNRKIYLQMSPTTPQAGSEAFNKWVNLVLNRYAKRHAEEYLVPYAWKLAAEFNVKPARIEISYGQKVLGRCSGNRNILLSRNLIFYPVELRRLVILHEFAHLTHLNHSDKFYRLLDGYLEGRHASLNAALKKHSLPFKK